MILSDQLPKHKFYHVLVLSAFISGTTFQHRMLQLKVRMKAIVHSLKNAPLPPQNITDFFVTLIEDGNYFNSNFLWACEHQHLEFNELGGTRNVVCGVSDGTDGDAEMDEEDDDDEDDDVVGEMHLSPFMSSGKQDGKDQNVDKDTMEDDKDTPNDDPENIATKDTQPPPMSASFVNISSIPRGHSQRGFVPSTSSKRNKKQLRVPPPPVNPKNIVTLSSQPDVPLDVGRARMLLQVGSPTYLLFMSFFSFNSNDYDILQIHC